jgi:hypothetical protein
VEPYGALPRKCYYYYYYVNNEPKSCPIATVREVGDTDDSTVYEIADGEETPTAGKDGEAYPQGQTYVLKAGPEVTNTFETRSVPESDTSVEQAIERCLQETRELCTRDVQLISSASEPEDQEEDERFPIPVESNESIDTAPPGE